jgi:uncharacterized membrane protein
MSYELPIALTLHLLASIVWVGGMFFAHNVLRPAVNELLAPPERLRLMLRVLDGFFPWVWGAIVTLLSSGFWIFFRVFHSRAGLYVHLMMGLGLMMTAVFVFLWLRPYRGMRRSLDQNDYARAALELGLIRRLMRVNLTLGLLVAVLAGARWPAVFG